MDERELLARVAAGDSAAAEEICAAWLDPVYRFVRARSGCPPAEAEDIVQETFVAFLRSVASFRGDASIYTWLCAIARRRLVDHFRSQGRRARHTAGPLDERLAVVAAPDPLPDEALVDAELRQEVLAEIWQLPEAQRQALLDKYVAGRSMADMAREAGKSVKAIESLLGRARAALRRRLVTADERSLPTGADQKRTGGGNHGTGSIRREPVTLARRRD